MKMKLRGLNKLKGLMFTSAIAIGIMFSLLLFGGCTKKIYVPVESVIVRTDTVREVKNILSTDTIREKIVLEKIQRDSISPIIDSLGKVIGYDRWHYLSIIDSQTSDYKSLKESYDSLLIARRDSIDRPVIVEVEKSLSTWQKIKLKSWWWFILALIAMFGFLLYSRSQK